MDDMMYGGPVGGAIDPVGVAETAIRDVRSREDADKASEDRKALVTRIITEVKRWKKAHEPHFKKMRQNVRFAANKNNEQWRDGVSVDADAYVANITHRFVQQKVAGLYARNPKARAKRKPRLDYSVWDGRQQTLQDAITTMTMLQQAGQAMGVAAMGVPGAVMPPQPAMQPLMDPATASVIVNEAAAARKARDQLDKIGKTGEILFHHFIDSMRPTFKSQMKQAVRRSSTCKVAWIKLDFERKYEGYRPETQTKANDAQDQIKHLEGLLHSLEAGELQQCDARLAELKLQLAALLSEPDQIVREGLVYDFPKSWHIIPDTECTQMVGLVGCKKLAHEYHGYTPQKIKERFGVDVGERFTAYRSGVEGNGYTSLASAKDGECEEVLWWEVYDSTTGLMYCVLDGYPDFLCEPAPPRVKVDQYFPYYAVVLNELETEGLDERGETDLYPPSDVELIAPQQKELNRSREALRQHRIAAQPYTVAGKDKIDAEDVDNIRNRAPHEVVLLNALIGNQKVSDVFQAGPTPAIDPNLYNDQPIIQDVLRVGGAQEANLGPTSGGTATEAGIAESSRVATVASNKDDIDDVLTMLARDSMDVMLREMSIETVRKIAGPGAVWPETPDNDLSSQIYLDIVAGSSGKPNRDRDAANIERLAPVALQVPGIAPPWLAKKMVETMDDAVDLDDALLDGIPSVLAMNAAVKNMGMPLDGGGPPGGEAQPSTGHPMTDPNQQGPAGAQNAPVGMGVPGGPQPAYPAPSGAGAALA